MSMLRKKIGSFYLVEKLGSGGMSEVFLGLNPKTKEKRAFKILGKSASISTSAYARFLREVDIIRGLVHPNIIKVLDSGVLENCYYYSMEFMPGGNLSRRVERGKCTITEAVKLFRMICNAVAYAHEQGIIHRDLKPSNILLSAEGNPVVSDFGIAKILGFERTTLTQPGEILGTIAYLAPEQRFSAKEVNRRADVFALGAIFYEMLMGFPPLGKFPLPVEVKPDFPVALSIILERCLALKPESRFVHAGLLQAELDKCPEHAEERTVETTENAQEKKFLALEDTALPAAKTDRIEAWLRILRTGTTRERLAGVREMVEQISPGEAKAILKLYPEEEDRVRWGLIRVLGDLRIEAATSLILADLNNPFHAECAIEALGKIGSEKAFDGLLEYVQKHPESALLALLPLAKTGKKKAAKHLRGYLNHEMAVFRQAAVRALASVATAESLQILKERLRIEHDEKVHSALSQSVRSLEALLLRNATAIVNDADTVSILRPANPDS
jgi:hypothetical protein